MTQDASSNGGAPPRAGLVLVALILVAAVANLNLSVANVALPSIGEAFDAGQTPLDLDRGRLLARPGVLGALARRARRPLRPQADAPPRHGAVDPGLLAGRLRPDGSRSSFVARVLGGARGRHGLPDDAGADHGAVGGAGAHHESIALWSGARRRHRLARPAARRLPAGALLLGLGLPRHAAARRGRPRHGARARAGARQRDDRAGRQPRRHPLARPRRRR